MEKANKQVRNKATQEIIERNDFLTERIEELLSKDKDDEANKLLEEQQLLHKKYNFFDHVFEQGELKGLKDAKGQVLVPAHYADFYETYDYNHYRNFPVCAVDVHGKCALVTTDGKGTPLTPFIYDGISIDVWSSFYICSQGKKKGVLDRKGNVLVPCIMDTIYMIFNRIIQVEANGKYGLYEISGLYVEPIFDEMTDKDDYVYVRLGDNWGYLDEDGTFIAESEQDKLDESCLLNFMPD